MGGGSGGMGGGPIMKNIMSPPAKQPEPMVQAMRNQAQGPKVPNNQNQFSDQSYQRALEDMMRRFGGGAGGMGNIRSGGGSGGMFGGGFF